MSEKSALTLILWADGCGISFKWGNKVSDIGGKRGWILFTSDYRGTHDPVRSKIGMANIGVLSDHVL